MKIWFDISGIYNWSGNFTGIQRIVYNLGSQLSRSGIESGYFIYKHGRFMEVSFRSLEDRLEAQKSASTTPVTITSKKLSLGKIRHHGIVALKNGVRSTSLERPSRFVYHNLRSTYRSLRSQKLKHTHSHLFNHNDAVIVIDGNWQFAGYVSQLIKAKKEIGFNLTHFVNDLVAVKNPALANTGANRIIGNYFRQIFEQADMLVAISESTKNDVEWFLDKEHVVNSPRVETVTLGDNIAHSKILTKKPKIVLPDDFILSVGTIEVRKNYTALYYAYKLAEQKNVKLPHLLIVGRKGWMAEEAESLITKDPEIKAQITVLQKADDQELEWLYKNCKFTVFPSFYEGWGLPIAESLARGKCCISSNTSSMPEVGGRLVKYVSPYDPAEIMNEIARLTDTNIRHKIEQDIKENYKSVTWGQTFEQLRKIIGPLDV